MGEVGYAALRNIALSNGCGELQSRQRNRNENGKKFFHGDSSFDYVASLPLGRGLAGYCLSGHPIYVMQIIVFAEREIAIVARYAIRTCSIAVARYATDFAKSAISVCASRDSRKKKMGHTCIRPAVSI